MQIAMRTTVWMFGEIRVGQYADRDRAQLDSLLTEMQISPQTRRTHPFLQWADGNTSPDFDGRNPLGVIPGSRAARPETRRALGHTSHSVGEGTQAALDVVVARLRADLAPRQGAFPADRTGGRGCPPEPAHETTGDTDMDVDEGAPARGARIGGRSGTRAGGRGRRVGTGASRPLGLGRGGRGNSAARAGPRRNGGRAVSVAEPGAGSPPCRGF